MRTASGGGSWPCVRKRRTLAYEAVSTSIENVESGSLGRGQERVVADAVVGLGVERGARGLQLRQLLARDGGARHSADDTAEDSTRHAPFHASCDASCDPDASCHACRDTSQGGLSGAVVALLLVKRLRGLDRRRVGSGGHGRRGECPRAAWTPGTGAPSW